MSLASSTVSGAAWSVAAGLGSRFAGLAATLLLTRFLPPSEYGAVAIAAIVALTLNQLTTLGVGVYLTAHPTAGRDVAFHATLLQVGLGVLPLALGLAFGVPLTTLLDSPGAARFLPLLAVAAFVDRAASMPERMALRALRFRHVSTTRATGELTYAAVAIIAAFGGAGGMAIVFGNLARSALRALVFGLSIDRREWLTPSTLKRSTFSLLARHGFWVSLAGVSDMVSRKWDTLVVASLFGPGIAGTYNLAYNLAELPALQVGEPITDVLQVSYAQVKDGERAEGLRRSLALIALIMAPLAFGLASVAEILARAVFPATWAGLGPMLAILALVSFVRPLDGAIVAYLQARSLPRIVSLIDGLGVVVLLVAMLTVGRRSPELACASVVSAFVVRGLGYFLALRLREGISLTTLLGSTFGPLVAALVMVAAVMLVDRALGGGPGAPIATLAIRITTGAAAYGLASRVLARRATTDFVALVRRMIARPG